MDKVDAIKWLQRIRTRQTGGRYDYDNARREAIDMACEALSEGAITVTRCEDCRWYDKGENDSESWQICTRHIGASYTTADDDYCSMAERKQC